MYNSYRIRRYDVSLISLKIEWSLQWSLLLEWISSEPDEIPLDEKWIFTLLELESSEIHSSTSEISSLHGRSELFTLFFFRRYNHSHKAESRIARVRFSNILAYVNGVSKFELTCFHCDIN